MSEQQTHSPEANPQVLDDLYTQAVDCLETWLHYGQAEVSPSAINPHLLVIKAKIPESNGKSLELDYERPAKEDDPTQVDREYPLIFADENGHSAWNTWVGIKVFDNGGLLIHDIDLAHSGNDIKGEAAPAIAYDKILQPNQDPNDENPAPVSMLEAKNLEAHMEWAAEELLDQQTE